MDRLATLAELEPLMSGRKASMDPASRAVFNSFVMGCELRMSDVGFMERDVSAQAVSSAALHSPRSE